MDGIPLARLPAAQVFRCAAVMPGRDSASVPVIELTDNRMRGREKITGVGADWGLDICRGTTHPSTRVWVGSGFKAAGSLGAPPQTNIAA